MHDTGHHPQNNQGKDAPGAPAAYTGPRFRTILADPPWDTHQRGPLGASRHYDLMTLDQIRGLPVAQLAQPDAHLWLWVTNATLRAGYDLAEAWGFTPRNVVNLSLHLPILKCKLIYLTEYKIHL